MKEMTKDNVQIQSQDIFKTIVMLGYLIVVVLLSIILSRGVNFLFDNIKTFRFWGEVLINLTFVLIVYNIVNGIALDKIKNNPDGKYFKAYTEFLECVNFISNNDKYDDLNKAIDTYNEELKENAYNKILYLITDRIKYNTLLAYDIEKNTYNLKPKELKKIIDLKQHLLAGTLKYAKAKAEYITKDAIIMPAMHSKSDLSFSHNKLRAIINGLVTFSFIGMNVLLNILKLQDGTKGLLQTITQQLFMFMTASASAFWYANLIASASVSSLIEKKRWCVRFNLHK